ncbi:FAD-binding oxidoreductase [Stieleria varia]|uniref:Benzoate 1,2-dioxygenase electron transfer component n=1 Tax=Stieleria varia TaxID=2528005 RepID=A0A5C6AJZ2_9BACT|nr:FAD-binding oxidoreductase [Stieleria varia]TWT98523.1 Benzoate 1,2-dioxygenase electron transfer component [Stieleria varia]
MNTKSDQRPQTGTADWNEYARHRGRVLHREELADNVHLYVVEKPDDFNFRPGQAVELAIDEQEWREQKRPFTLTSLPSNPRLEFVIKSYPVISNPEHEGMTEHLGRDICVGDRVIFGDAWGAIEYSGPGVFIAGGAGITPFIAIIRQLEQEQKLAGNRLFFSNKRVRDVFLQGELFRCLGHRVVCTLTEETHPDYESGRIDKDWLQSRVKSFDQQFYVCGPPPMVDDISVALQELGADPHAIVTEDTE